MSDEIDRKDFMLLTIIVLLAILLLCGCSLTVARVPVVTPVAECEIEINAGLRVPWLAGLWDKWTNRPSVRPPELEYGPPGSGYERGEL